MKKKDIKKGTKVWMIRHQTIGIVFDVTNVGSYMVSMTYLDKKEDSSIAYINGHEIKSTGEIYVCFPEDIVILP